MLGGSDSRPGNVLMVTGPGGYTRVSKLEARMLGQKCHSWSFGLAWSQNPDPY